MHHDAHADRGRAIGDALIEDASAYGERRLPQA